MLFVKDVTIPADTKKASPVEGVIEITRAVIKKIEISFAFGCRNMVGIQLFWGEHPIFPRNPDEWIKGDGYVVSGECFYFIYQEPYQVKYRAHSEGTSYDHTLIVRINMLPVWALYPFSDEMYRMAQMEELGETST